VTVEIIDTHCHLNVAEFDADRPAVLQRAIDRGVCGIVIPGVVSGDWPGLRDFCAGDGRLYPAYGLHPVYLEQHQPIDLQALETWLEQEPAVAVGEIGLDFYVDGLDHQRQQVLFEKQLQLARAASLPVLLHVRKAHDQVLATLKRIRVCGGIAHAYNGSLQQAAQYRDLGFRFGFGGMLTFERSSKLRALARELPLDDLVLETDAPDMTVVQHRGERNSPEYLPYCLAALAEIREEPVAELACRTTANAREVLRLDNWNPAGG
jgi:TatD DNase family protein